MFIHTPCMHNKHLDGFPSWRCISRKCKKIYHLCLLFLLHNLLQPRRSLRVVVFLEMLIHQGSGGGLTTHSLCNEKLCSGCINSSTQLLWSSTAEERILKGWPLVPTHHWGYDVEDCSCSLLRWTQETAVNQWEAENVLTARCLKGLIQWEQAFHYSLGFKASLVLRQGYPIGCYAASIYDTYMMSC